MRLTKDGRHEQLLEVAGELLVERGPTALTMERLAEWAGVSKALPYAHFDNAQDVLLALRDRETGRVARIVWERAAETPREDLVAAIVTAFFDAVEVHHDLLGLLTGPGAIVSDPADATSRLGPGFVALFLGEFTGIGPAAAKAAAPVVLAILMGAVDGWTARDGKRATMEAIAVAALGAALDTATSAVGSR